MAEYKLFNGFRVYSSGVVVNTKKHCAASIHKKSGQFGIQINGQHKKFSIKKVVYELFVGQMPASGYMIVLKNKEAEYPYHYKNLQLIKRTCLRKKRCAIRLPKISTVKCSVTPSRDAPEDPVLPDVDTLEYHVLLPCDGLSALASVPCDDLSMPMPTLYDDSSALEEPEFWLGA